MHKNSLHGNPNWKGGRYIENGYVWIRVSPGTYRQEHLLAAEKALGRPLDQIHPVHHFDKDRSNNKNTNLVICEDRSYHALLHRRQRIVEFGGDPNTQKICSRCKLPKNFDCFSKSVNHACGLNTTCRDCMKIKNQASWRLGSCSNCGQPCDRDCDKCRPCWRKFKRGELGD